MSTSIDQQQTSKLAIVLPGGGARGAYQAGVLRALGRALPNFQPNIVTGVSAGAINAAFLARSQSSFSETTFKMAKLWSALTTSMIVRDEPRHVMANAARWGLRLLSGRFSVSAPVSLLDTSPLRELLARFLPDPQSEESSKTVASQLDGWAVTATNYCSGQAETFVEGGRVSAPSWERPYRRGIPTHIHVDHVLASSALPLLFPPVRIGDAWFGDGGVRQDSPLSPALHLGAEKLLVISTSRGLPAQSGPLVSEQGAGCAEPGRVLGVVLNALIHDHVDHDVAQLSRITRLLRQTKETTSELRAVDAFVVRPSIDIGAVAATYEATLPRLLRHLLRGWGTKGARSADLLSTVLFESAFTQALVACGERDADQQMDDIRKFLAA